MFQAAEDFIVYIGWFFQNVILILKTIFLPVRYIFAFLKSVVTSAFAAPVTSDLGFSIDSGTLDLFHSIPYFHYIFIGVFCAISISIIIFLLKTFQKT